MLLRKYLLQNALKIVHVITTTTAEGTEEDEDEEKEEKIKRGENIRGYLSVTTNINQRILSPSFIPCFPSLFFLSDH
jgi:hypothetical protein